MKKEIQSVKNYFNESMGTMRKTFSSFLAWFQSKKVMVETEVKGAEQIEQAKQKVESLPKTKTLEVKVEKKGDFSGLGLSGKNTEKTISLKSEVTGLDQVNQLRTVIQKILTSSVHAQTAPQSGGQIIRTGVISMRTSAKTMKKHNLIMHQMTQRIFNAILVVISPKLSIILWGRKMRIGNNITSRMNTKKHQSLIKIFKKTYQSNFTLLQIKLNIFIRMV